MNTIIREIEPHILWNHFADLNAVPRPSKKEERIVAFMLAFGKKLGLETQVDNVQNILIKKPATVGMEDRKTVVLQSHLDMVHQKNEETTFDFDKQGIQMKINEDWVCAKGTTLGADNGIGVAAMMSILSSKDIAHPPIEALFTIDEETGMSGAKGLKADYLSGEILLNLDTEDDDEIAIGCAGGIDVTATQDYDEIDLENDCIAYRILIKGLQGGHSGMDIHKGFGNANKIMNRILYDCSQNNDIQLANLNGGNLRNAIPRESKSTIVLKKNTVATFENLFHTSVQNILKEFKTIEPQLTITYKTTELPKKIMDLSIQKKFIQTIYGTLNGVYCMNTSISNLVETSNNLASVSVERGKINIACLTRSFSESGKKDLANALKSIFELGGFRVELSGDYPGWEPNTQTKILQIASDIYQKMFDKKANVMACHAGLECGILGKHYPKMEIISFGPTIKGAHSPDEKVNVKSTQKFWKFLKELLKNTPKKS